MHGEPQEHYWGSWYQQFISYLNDDLETIDHWAFNGEWIPNPNKQTKL